jgi:dTDP-4-dehydrorhamnose reductase
MKIVLTGSDGNLGSALLREFMSARHEVIPLTRDKLDITELPDVINFMHEYRPDMVVNAAAYNNVDAAETAEGYSIAYAVNAAGPKHLAYAASRVDAGIMHFSSDYVFSGARNKLYTEADEPHPISRYGDTKFAGERFVADGNPNHFIIRLSKIFGPAGSSEDSKSSFVDTMLRLGAERDELKIVDSEVGSPGYTVDIAKEVSNMITERVEPGIYHLTNAGKPVSWFEFAQEIFAAAGLSPVVLPVDAAAFPRDADRPVYAPITSTKRPLLRSREEALKEYIELINAERE